MNAILSSIPGLSASQGKIGFVISIFTIIAMWMIFEKAGQEGWKAIIPIYNFYVTCKFVFGNGWLFLIMLIPFVNIIFLFVYLYKLAKAFGYGFAFTLGLIFFEPIFMMILGFGSSEYIGPQ